jgi:hypothetical protein
MCSFPRDQENSSDRQQSDQAGVHLFAHRPPARSAEIMFSRAATGALFEFTVAGASASCRAIAPPRWQHSLNRLLPLNHRISNRLKGRRSQLICFERPFQSKPCIQNRAQIPIVNAIHNKKLLANDGKSIVISPKRAPDVTTTVWHTHESQRTS